MNNKITIIPDDSLVMIDGRGFDGLDMTDLPSTIHAVQWYGEYGVIEYKTEENGVKPANERIASLDGFEAVIAAWETAREAADAPIPEVEPTLEQIATTLLQYVDTHLRATANSRNYDSIDSAAKYIGNTLNPKWAAEGVALRDWAILVYDKCYEIQAEVVAGNMPIPTIEELIAMLPEMVWPA